MFERVYLGHTEAQHERAREVVARVFAHLATIRTRCRRLLGRPRAADRRLRCRHDRSLRPRLRGPAVVPRFTEDSKQRVIAAADMVDVVSGRTQLRKVGSVHGPLSLPRGRTPSFSVNAVDKLYYCFGCGAGGDLIKFVRETEQLDFAGAVEWLAERFRVQLEYEEMSPQLEASRKRRDRLHEVLDQAAAFYERHLWETEAGAPVRGRTSSRAGSARRSAASSGSGSRPAWASRRKRSRRASRGRAPRGGPDKRAGQRLLPPPADVPTGGCPRPDRRLPGAQASRGRSAARQVRQLARGGALPQVGDPVRAPLARRDREAGARDRRRGQHRRDRASPGRARAGCRLHGNSADGAAREGALPPHPASVPLLRHGARGRRPFAAWSSRSGGGSTSASTARRARIPPTRPSSSKVGWERPRATSATRPPRARAGTGSADGPRAGAGVPRGVPDSPERQAWRHANDRLGMTVQLQSAVSTMKAAPVSPQGHGRRRPARAGRARRMHRLPVSTRSPPPGPGGSLRQRASPSPARRDPRRRRRRGDRPALAELDAVARPTRSTSRPQRLLLRLRERHLRRRLAEADLEETSELQQQLLEIRAAVSQLA